MGQLSQLYLPGTLALWCALFFALASTWGYVQVMRGRDDLLSFSRHAYSFFALAVTLASLVLLIALLRRDFRIEYVYQYSGLDLTWNYQLAAFWAGQKGSFLIWLLWGALLGIPLYRSTGKDEASVMTVYLLTQFGLLFILARENPFVMLPETPVDGAGLNPLLQDNWMVIHPPVMFVGYAATAIPFAFAIAALWKRDTSRWAVKAFPWALGGFLVLGTAILMGGYWAYKTLGWGGYWGWDPVENASLIPWILGTAMIHGLYLERTKGRFRRSNFILACLTYISVLYGTFLTRSGVLADFSVHSFVDLGISGWLIALLAFFIFISVALAVTRLKDVSTVKSEDPFFSRGSFMTLGTLTLLTSAVVITVGTSAPLLTRFMDNPGQVGPEFYNRVNLPIALIISSLLAFVPYLTWKQSRLADILRKLVMAAVFGALVAAFAFWKQVGDPFHLLFIFFSATALASNTQRSFQIARQRKSFSLGGGYLAHVGVAIILLGVISSSGYDESHKITLEQGQPGRMGDLELTFTRYLDRTADEKERMEVQVVRDDGLTYFAYPKFFMNDRTRQLMVKPHIHKTLFEDLYISPIEFDPGSGGRRNTVQLAKDQSVSVGSTEVRFLGFQMGEGHGNTEAGLAGSPTEIGAVLEIQGPQGPERIVPRYIFTPQGPQTPLATLADGRAIQLAGINASAGAVELVLQGFEQAADFQPSRLSIDVTRKPLINMVWYGLYFVLLGGAFACYHRYRQASDVDRIEELAEAKKAESVTAEPSDTDGETVGEDLG